MKTTRISPSRLILTVLCVLALTGCQEEVKTTTPVKGTPSTTPQSLATSGVTPYAPSAPTPTMIPTTAPHLQIDPQILKGIIVRFWHPWTGAAATAVKEMVAEFNRDNLWGVQAEVVSVGGTEALNTRFSQAVRKGEKLPQLVAAAPDQLAAFYLNKAMVDLNPYVNDAQWGYKADEIAAISPVFWGQGASGGARFGVPAWGDIQVIFYNQTWAAELGFNIPPTIPQEFQAQMCAAGAAIAKDEDKSNDGTGGWFVSTQALAVLSWMNAFGEQKLPAGESDSYLFNTETNKTAFTYLKTLYDKGCSWTGRNSLPYEYFSTRKALAYSGTLADVMLQEQADEHFKNGDQWLVLPYPTRGDKPIVLASGISYGMTASSPNEQLAAWTLLRFLVSARNQARLLEVSGIVPPTTAGLENLPEYRKQHPRWNQGIGLTPFFQAAPSLGSWRAARPVLQDVAWQLYQPTLKTEDIPNILSQVDETILAILKKGGN